MVASLSLSRRVLIHSAGKEQIVAARHSKSTFVRRTLQLYNCTTHNCTNVATRHVNKQLGLKALCHIDQFMNAP